jgi:hypothetical protein
MESTLVEDTPTPASGQTRPIELRLFEHVLGEFSPLPALLSRGTLDQQWVNRYLRLLEAADATWHGRANVPSQLLAALRAVAWNFPLRYRAWSNLDNRRNEATEQHLANLQKATDALLGSLRT